MNSGRQQWAEHDVIHVQHAKDKEGMSLFRAGGSGIHQVPGGVT